MRFAWMAVGGMLALLTVTGEAQLGAGAHHYSTDYILGSAPAQPYWICVGATAVPEGEVLTGVVCIGDVTVAGEVRGDVVAIGGSITLEPTALVAGNVTAVCGDVVQARSARVLGEVAAQQLPEVRSIDLPSQGADPSRFHIGDATIRDEKLETVIAIGGTLTIAGASDVANTRVLGGDLVVEGEAKTGSAHVVGGTTTFPGEEPHPANVTEPQVLICSGGSKTPAAKAWIEPRIKVGASDARLTLWSPDPWHSNASVYLRVDTNGSLGLTMKAVAAQRRPEGARPAPEGRGGGGFGGGGRGGGGLGGGLGGGGVLWPAAPIFVPNGSPPALARSTALGVGFSVESRPGKGQHVSEVFALSVPADAGSLAQSPGAHGGGRY